MNKTTYSIYSSLFSWHCHVLLLILAFILVCSAFAAHIYLLNRKRPCCISYLLFYSSVRYPAASSDVIFSMRQHLASECRPCFKEQEISDKSIYAPLQKKKKTIPTQNTQLLKPTWLNLVGAEKSLVSRGRCFWSTITFFHVNVFFSFYQLEPSLAPVAGVNCSFIYLKNEIL